ncbi:hypothetical protein [Butyrivibrio sp.]|uniref:hypothetical protein n=1 Tax=Butyrivibrio sp. TaxID=28121 RepID=UPI0025C6DA83|nr:hypothetical protein [Butyrivibrio sp.]MBQ9305022.1 hypothetical protein [Butyrivibrio sp.]
MFDFLLASSYWGSYNLFIAMSYKMISIIVIDEDSRECLSHCYAALSGIIEDYRRFLSLIRYYL